MIDDKLKELIPKELLNGQDDLIDSLTNLLDLIDKSNKNNNEDCEDDEEDCGDVLSPCCNAPLDNIHGTLPLEVRCVSCSKTYLLKNLVLKK